MSAPRFILLDGRAKLGDEDDATVMDTAETETDARKAGSSLWKDHDAIWSEEGIGLRWDIPPASRR